MGLFRLAGLALTLIAVLVACPEPTKPPTLSPPKINAFSATPNALTKAGTVTLEWNVTDSISLSITPNAGVVTGSSKTVNVTISTTFELTAQNPSNPVPLMQSTALDFPIPTVSYGSGGTYPCQVTVKVTPVNDASRVKFLQVWSG